MKISVTNAGKRYNREWIFRSLELELHSGKHWAITGHNGSGKSTLLQCIAGSMYLNEGSIQYYQSNQIIQQEELFKHISICAPYLEVIEEMSATEFLNYHSSFKPFKENWTTAGILEEVGLQKSSHKQIRYFSSGMKQRVKLAQAFFSDAEILLLDEPCTNLDQAGIDLYKHLIDSLCQDRLVLISSNDPTEYASCSDEIRMGV
ncbi:MAG: ATP-binding cassette domain-containing protein [bacterium]|jgi:ABC-type multidrug transport system ATPase subunit